MVETLVAISILLLVVVGPMTTAQKGIKNAYFANEQVTAVFLAQEAIEAVRAVRDVRALLVYGNPAGDTAGWAQGLGCTSGCAYIRDTNTFGPCVENNSCRLEVGTTGAYDHDVIGGIDSPFTRVVTVGNAVAGGVPVTVVVSWNSNLSGPKSVTLQTWVYDHYQRFES